MKNNKFIKLAATAALGVMTAASSIGFVACDTNSNNGGGNGGENPPEHNWATEWKYDNDYHWHECEDEDCDETSEPEEHDIKNHECTVCDYVEHKFSEKWSTDENNHWHACEYGCTETKGEEAHNFVDGECTICHYEKVEAADLNFATYTISNQVTNNLQKVFKVGDTFNSDNLTVYDKESGEKLESGSYTVALKEGEDMQTAGKKTVEITAGELKSTYVIYVLDLSGVSTAGEASVTVDPFESVGVSDNVVTVKSINDALKVYELLGVGANVKKVINVADGDYYEKVYINLPNVKLIGTNERKAGAGNSGDNGAVIWFDNLAGEKDPSGGDIGTFSSYSVRVGANAMDFEARNITFKNKYNTYALYAQSESYLQEKYGNKNTQAVALRVDSGSAEFYNCKMTGYHDTLHVEGGNHYYEECWIEGHTDYIFGNDSNTYFYKCNIYSIGAGSANNGGYVVANRPSTTNYICVFNECKFDADSNSVDGTVALGRPWGENMKMAVIYSTISAKFSTRAHTEGNNNGDRYCTMNEVDPNPEYMMEYGNDGAGAISESIAKTCTYLTELQAAEYKIDKIENLLGFIPGESDAKKLYDFTAFAYESSSTNTGDEGGELFDGDMVIKGTYRMNGNSVQITAGTKIIIKVSGKASITWYPGQGTDADASVNYKNGCAEIVILSNVYIISVTVNTAHPGEHTHVYGDWSVAPIPSEADGGVAVRSCTDCELETPHSQTVNLPALSENDYNITASANTGKANYTYDSDYGPITFEADALAGVHVHHYGEWTVTAIPGDDEVGEVSRTCGDNDCNHDAEATQSKELPVLGDSSYKITDDTATAQSAGTGTYTITIEGIDEPVSFTAPTPKLTTTTFNFGDYAASSKPENFFDGKITVNSNYWMHGQAIKVTTGDTIVINMTGAITVGWWGGSLGSEDNGVITYKNGFATITIVNADSGVYIKTITVDHTNVPEDTPQTPVVTPTTFNFGLLENKDSTAYTEDAPADPFGEQKLLIVGTFRQQSGTGIQIVEGAVLTFQVSGRISVEWYGTPYGTAKNGEITYKDGCATLNIVRVADDADSANGIYIKSITVDPSDIPEDTPTELNCLTNGFMLTVSDNLTSSANALIEGVTIHNEKYLLLGSGAFITVRVKAGSSITLYADQYYGASVKFNTTEVAAETDYTFSYTAEEEGNVTITSTGTTYFLYLNVDCGAYSSGGILAVGECPIKYESNSGVFHGAIIDATSGKLALSGENGGYKYAQANEGLKISFKVTEGITEDNIRVIAHNGTVLDEGAAYNIEITDGEVTITIIGGTQYLRLIQIV